MRCYHRTISEFAAAILSDGFRDGHGRYMTDRELSGVWFSSEPLDENEGAAGDTLLMLELPAALFEEFECVEEGKTYREALIPAEVVNGYGRPVVVVE